MIRLFALLLASIALAACSSHPSTTAAASAAPAPAATNPLAGTPMAAYGHDLNRAKDVQKMVDQQAKQQAKAIDDATSGH